MHPAELRAQVLELASIGLAHQEIARRLHLSRSTVRDICRAGSMKSACPRCWKRARNIELPPPTYAYLLGLYLGDGCIAPLARTYSFRLSLDARYTAVIAEAREALASISAAGRVSEHLAGPRRTTDVLCVYGLHLPCLFPQHGPGKKHERRIELEPWQREIVREHAWSLLRGLIQTDGCRFVNRTGPYGYVSYEFSQRSTDIRRIFTDACDLVGVRYRVYPRYTRVYHRASVAMLEAHVGAKT